MATNVAYDAVFPETIPREITTPQITQESYETRRWSYLLASPIMWVLTLWVMAKKAIFALAGRKPTTNTFWFDGVSSTLRRIKETAGTAAALDIIYNHQFGMDGKITDFWLGMMNAQAVRNRKRLVESLLLEHLRKSAKHESELYILSVACGSAQSILETIALLKREGIICKAVLLDKDETALAYCRRIALAHGLKENIDFDCIQEHTRRLERALMSYPKFDVIEIVGLFDYLKDEWVIKLTRTALSFLKPEGVLLIGNTASNIEQHFLRWVIDWRMAYRNATELRALAIKADAAEVETISEPLGIHNIAICRW